MIQKKNDIDDLQDQLHNLQRDLTDILNIYEPIKKARDEAQNVFCQTEETTEHLKAWLENNLQLEQEN